MDKIEKERKFLLKRMPQIKWDESLSIVQYYINGYRYRAQISGDDIRTEIFQRIKKVKTGVGINQEVGIRDMTRAEFAGILKGHPEYRKISKNRYIKNHNGKVFEVDQFANCTLIIVEVEDVEMGDQIEFPPEIQEQILMEVTGNEQFDNFNLAK